MHRYLSSPVWTDDLQLRDIFVTRHVINFFFALLQMVHQVWTQVNLASTRTINAQVARPAWKAEVGRRGCHGRNIPPTVLASVRHQLLFDCSW